MVKIYRPGQHVPRSGQYEKIGPRGGETERNYRRERKNFSSICSTRHNL